MSFLTLSRVTLLSTLLAALLLGPSAFAEGPSTAQDSPAKGKAEKTTKVSSVTFEGNQHLSADRLRRAIAEELEEYAKDPRDAYLDDAAYEIGALYRSEGYPQAEVSYQQGIGTGPGEDPGKGPVFLITEGPRVTVTTVLFEGNTAYSSQQLRAFFESTRDGLLIKGEGPFSKNTVEGEARQVQDLYRSVGYLEASLGDLMYVWSEDGQHVTITVPIDEGPLFTLTHLDLAGAEALHPDTERSLRAEFAGRPFLPRTPFQIRGRLQGSFGNRGFPDAEIEPQVTMDDQTGEVSLAFACTTGPQVSISEVIIKGAERTRERFIRSRIDIQPGQIYNEKLQRETFRRLYRSSLFRSVRIVLGDTALGEAALEDAALEDAGLGDGQEESRPLIVTVEESSSREVFVEPGFGSYEGLRLRLGFKERNLFGAGIRLRGDAVIAQKAYNASLTYSDPWTSIDSLTTEISLSTNERELDGFTTHKTGIGAALRQEWSDKVSSSFGYQFRRSENRDSSTGEPIIAVSQEDVDISSIFLFNRYDDRNNIFVPTEGSRAELDLEYGTAALGSELSFFRIQTTAASYQDLSETTTLALALRAGAILPVGSQSDIPLQERFLSGGENSVRAFQEGRLLPTNSEGVELVDDEGNSQGGEAFATFTAELRRRLYGNLQGAIFVDSGFLSADARDFFSPSEIRSGAGIGLRYLLPIGPLRLDGAWNLDAREGEESFVLHFSVGMAI